MGGVLEGCMMGFTKVSHFVGDEEAAYLIPHAPDSGIIKRFVDMLQGKGHKVYVVRERMPGELPCYCCGGRGFVGESHEACWLCEGTGIGRLLTGPHGKES